MINNSNEVVVERIFEQQEDGIEQLIESLAIEALPQYPGEELIDKICSDANHSTNDSSEDRENKVKPIKRRKKIKG